MRHKNKWIHVLALLILQFPLSGLIAYGQQQTEPRGFAERPERTMAPAWLEDGREAERRETQVRWEDNPPFPIRLSDRPNEPTICQQKDLARDQEFRMCMHQLLGTLASERPSLKSD